jgi:putative oxidoreductase
MKKRTMKRSEVTEESVERVHTSKDKSCMCGSCASDCAAWGLTILRVVVGAAFMWHGISKFMDLAGTQGFFSQLFGAAGPILAVLVATVEVLGGLALVLGIFTKWASYLLAVVLAVAIIWAKKFGWPAIELDLVLLALIALAWNGPGRYALHDKCGCC